MAKGVLAIDLGGSKAASAVIDYEGHVYDYGVIPIDRRGGDYVVKQVVDMVRGYASRHRLDGIGISIPGIVDGGVVIWAPNIRGWRNVPLRERVEEALRGINVALIDDRAASILGEAWMGEARGLKNAVTLIIGTGVALGALINGAVAMGAHDTFGAIGWWMLGTRPRRSRRGYLEGLVSGPALFKALARLCRIRHDEDCLRFLEGCEPGSAECVFKAVDVGVKHAEYVVRKAALIVGITVGNIISALDPEAVILNGGVGIALGERYLEEIRGVALKVAQPYSSKRCRILVSKLGYLANLYGAAKIIMS